MRAVVNTLSYFATKRQKNITLIVSTTGDTGPAAVQAGKLNNRRLLLIEFYHLYSFSKYLIHLYHIFVVSDAENPLLNILVHYPLGQISAFQRKQLTTVNSTSVKVATFEGGGDDMDAPIKNMLKSSSKSNDSKQMHLCGVNSYNIGRPLVQMVHFVSAFNAITFFHCCI